MTSVTGEGAQTIACDRNRGDSPPFDPKSPRKRSHATKTGVGVTETGVEVTETGVTGHHGRRGDVMGDEQWPVPQVWDLAPPSTATDDLELAAELTRAESAGVTLSDRLAGAVGDPVRLRLADGSTVTGVVEAAFADGVAVVADTGTVVVPVMAIRTVVVGAAVPPQQARHPLGIVSRLREFAGASIALHLVDGAVVRGTLVAVAADHLVVAAAGERLLVPIPAVAAVRFP